MTAWRYLPALIAMTASLGIGHVLATKTLPQAAMDCAAFCEMEIGE